MKWTRDTMGGFKLSTYSSDCGHWVIDNCKTGRRNWGLWYRETPKGHTRKVADTTTLGTAKEWAEEMASYGVTTTEEARVARLAAYQAKQAAEGIERAAKRLLEQDAVREHRAEQS